MESLNKESSRGRCTWIHNSRNRYTWMHKRFKWCATKSSGDNIIFVTLNKDDTEFAAVSNNHIKTRSGCTKTTIHGSTTSSDVDVRFYLRSMFSCHSFDSNVEYGHWSYCRYDRQNQNLYNVMLFNCTVQLFHRNIHYSDWFPTINRPIYCIILLDLTVRFVRLNYCVLGEF